MLDGQTTAPQNDGVDNITVTGAGQVFVAEDGPEMRICTVDGGDRIAPFLSVTGHQDSEVTGPAFTPDGTRLYFSSQRGAGGDDEDGVTYEVRGPFRLAPPDGTRPLPTGGRRSAT